MIALVIAWVSGLVSGICGRCMMKWSIGVYVLTGIDEMVGRNGMNG